jgi:hypothetical protein
MDSATPNDAARDALVADLKALVDALDRRVPRAYGVAEPAIARAAAVLRQEALRRLAALQAQEEKPPPPTLR